MEITKFSIMRYWEKYWPAIVSLLAAYIYLSLEVEIDQEKTSSLLSSAISISAILMGFLGTSKAILLSYSSNRLNWLKKKGNLWGLLISFFKSSFLANFMLCIYTLLLLSGVADTLNTYISTLLSDRSIFFSLAPINIFFALWVFLILFSITTFYRIIDLFFTLLASE